MAKPDTDYRMTLSPHDDDGRRLFAPRRTPLQRIVEALLPVLWLASFVALGAVALWG